MPKYRRLDINFHEVKNGADGIKRFPWDTMKVSALYDLRDQLDDQNHTAREILAVLRRMDRRMQASMLLRRGRR
jgi:hypothetical protein